MLTPCAASTAGVVLTVRPRPLASVKMAAVLAAQETYDFTDEQMAPRLLAIANLRHLTLHPSLFFYRNYPTDGGQSARGRGQYNNLSYERGRRRARSPEPGAF